VLPGVVHLRSVWLLKVFGSLTVTSRLAVTLSGGHAIWRSRYSTVKIDGQSTSVGQNTFDGQDFIGGQVGFGGQLGVGGQADFGGHDESRGQSDFRGHAVSRAQIEVSHVEFHSQSRVSQSQTEFRVHSEVFGIYTYPYILLGLYIMPFF
jgi:hypothetical protein